MSGQASPEAAVAATAIATVPTASASRYLQQLCKHWSHKFVVSFTTETGRIELPGGIAALTADASALRVVLTAESGDRLATLKRVVAEHLDRFAFREAPLPFDWTDAEGGSQDGT